ncbi:c2H2-type domain-containing protein [Trichonephila inaurata madagascariensis]|uniref:C2H2-type domain-containing protein n=1 Tax=Trichonephila inaurata madagascariensis TaxID=2747483 RepID=A0A8X6WNU5_9ARAC|nr:c2H2-type domain-containing protein [Trichonephila inaurata madagascariensis]
MSGKSSHTLKIECRICNLGFTGVIPCATHLLSKSHSRKKLKSSPTDTSQPTEVAKMDLQEWILEKSEELSQLLYCEVCDVKATSVEPMLEHYQSKKHAKNVHFHAVTKKHVDIKTYEMRFQRLIKENQDRSRGVFRCGRCFLIFPTKNKYKTHMKSKRHYTRLNVIRSAKIIAKFKKDLRWVTDKSTAQNIDF